MADVNPITLVVAELLSRLEARDFTPFEIILSDGSRHAVPTPEHCTITRLLRRVEVENDDGRVAFINPLHVTKIESYRQPAA